MKSRSIESTIYNQGVKKNGHILGISTDVTRPDGAGLQTNPR